MRSNLSIQKEISPEYSLEGWMLKLKLPYFGHLMQRTDSFEKTLMLGKLKMGGEGYDRGWDDWTKSLTRWTWLWASSRTWWWTGRPGVLQSMGSQRVGHDWVTEMNWLIAFRVCARNMLINSFFFFFFDCGGSSLLQGLFFRCSKQGLLPRFGTRTSHCSGFSCEAQVLGLQWLWHVGSRSQTQ